MRILRIAVAVLLVLVLVVVAAAAILGYWLVHSAFPQTEGELRVAGLQAPVTVQRDTIGVPHISAESTEDLYFAHGYTHAQDRFYQMDVRRHIAAGRLSEMFGEQYLAADTFVRTVGWYRVAEQEYALLNDESRLILQSYANGVNAYLGAKRESEVGLQYRMLGVTVPSYRIRQWDPVDSLAWLKVFAWDLRQNMGNEIARVLAADQVGLQRTFQLFPPYPYDRVGTIVNADDLQTERLAGSDGRISETDAMLSPEAVQAFRDAAGGAQQLAELLSPQGEGLGSNSWVVGPDLTESGAPLLANDPHLTPGIPGPWAQVGLQCEDLSADCPYRVSGWSMPGLPGVLIGHNDNIAWGLTNLGADVTDLVLEKVEGDTYEFDGRSLPLTIRTETIDIAGGGSVDIEVRETVHGPIISDQPEGEFAEVGRVAPAPAPGQKGDQDVPERGQGYAVALRWTGLEPKPVYDGFLDLATASDWESFREATRSLTSPPLSLIYADTQGNIGYQAPGRIPLRQNYNGRWPVPGWDSSYDWDGFVGFDDLPNVLNPNSGWITTANQFVVPAEYPFPIQADVYAYGSRALRINERIAEATAQGPLSVEDLQQIQMDNGNNLADFLVPRLIELRDRGELTGVAADAIGTLEGWDYQQPRDSAAAALFNVFYRNLVQAMFLDEIGQQFQPDAGDRYWQAIRVLWKKQANPWWDDTRTAGSETRNETVQASLIAARNETGSLLGDTPEDWRWGDVHRLPFDLAYPPLTPQSPSLGDVVIERVFDRGPVGVAGGGSIPNATAWNPVAGYDAVWVPTMRQVVDLADFDASTWVNLTGASGHPFHPNYSDQIDTWVQGRQFIWPYTPEAIAGQTQQTLTLQPAGGARKP